MNVVIVTAYCYTSNIMVTLYVGVRTCVLVMFTSRAEKANPIEMLFGVVSWMDTRNHVLQAGPSQDVALSRYLLH